MKDDMFYKAGPLIFKKAEELRNRQTDTEELLWNYLRQSQLGIKFRRQHPTANYVLDFYAHKIKLAIEIDGSIHSLEEVKRNDKERQSNLESLGISFLRVTNRDVKEHLDSVIEKINIKTKELLEKNSSAKSSPLGTGGLQIIPAIDIIDGKCVRLTEGDYSQKKIYNEHPLEVAKQFEDAGLQRLHLVDLDGAKAGAVKNWKVLETIAGKTSLIIDFGGGIKKEEDVKVVFNSGAALATVGSIAVKDEALFVSWMKQFGADKFLLGADVKDEKIAVGGWLETTDIWIYDFIEKYIAHGVQQIFCTDVSKDGRLEGPSTELYKNIIQKFPQLHFIASGGVSSMKDLEELQQIGCKGAIVGKAIYEGRLTLDELKHFA
ncbi:MAG: 1-(5-phosphoribosyl)-5-[(5-phosphoribosylamino)methylideneamino]imidazole-4-carboxamide isomerase [Chitinophagaceae bacterium]|nr:1-(5-phosphoribosyl)-5-[(5-phosphoribosylamino)methylideneamino]imidazole-4-carboxamide isomerase [Chitinophagaceae bacterium]